MVKGQNFWITLRIMMGFIFFWAFLDKLFGLGFNTPADASWLSGASPTFGYLNFATYGPLAAPFQAIAGNPIADILYMAGMAGVGIALILGIALRLGGYSGALMMGLIYLSALPKEFNPIIDEHIIYIVVLVGIAVVQPVQFGLGQMWRTVPIVERNPILQ